MTDNDYELLQHCIDTDEFVTTKTANHYLLFHEHILNSQLDLESPNAFIRKLFQSNGLSIENAQITSHVHPSAYAMIIFADRSIVHTPSKTFANPSKKRLPYYVPEDLEILRKNGMSANDIDLFVNKLNEKEYPNLDKYDRIIQKILDWADAPTRLKCRQVSQKWKTLVDNSPSWHSVKLSKNCPSIKQALTYFQHIDIRELDLSQCSCESFTLEKEFHIYSLRSLCISTDHPLEFFTLLFQIAPFLQNIQLIQTYHSSKFASNDHLYDCITFVISQCQQRLKCLRCLHIQLRSISDQIFLQSSSNPSIPISYEVIHC